MTREKLLFAVVLGVGTTALIVGCTIKQVREDSRPVNPPGFGGYSPSGTLLAGTFQNILTVGNVRVSAPQGVTAMILASLDASGKALWASAFPGMAVGRAVRQVALPRNPKAAWAVAGIFSRNISFGPAANLTAGDGEGLFLTGVTALGRVSSAALIVRAKHLSSPELTVAGDLLSISISYTGAGEVDGKPIPAAERPTLLRLTVTLDGKKIVTVPTPLTAFSVSGQACNVCVSDDPTTNPVCTTCRDTVSTAAPDTWCRDTGWDRQCMDEALNLCPAGSQTCNCPHGAGLTGQWLHPACMDTTTGTNSCVFRICQADHYCQSVWWDSMCVGERSTCP